MTRGTLSVVVCLLGVLTLGLSGGWAAENAPTTPKQDIPRPDDKPADMTKPVQVFILMGQSNMVGMGKISGRETTGRGNDATIGSEREALLAATAK